EEFHDRPQVTDVVLDRRAGESDTVVCRKCPRSPRLLGLRVFDVLRLVQEDTGPGYMLQDLEVSLQERVAGDDHGLLLRLRLKCGASRPRDTMVDHDRQLRRKAGSLLVPVAYYRSRTDQQHRLFAPRFPLSLDQRQGLDRLS